MIHDPKEVLLHGSEILVPLLLKHGFEFKLVGGGSSSGGEFAFGEFRRDTRRLELHVRYSLGMVTYHFANRSMSHQDYMRSVLGRPSASHYPGFSSDPLNAFRHLYLDLDEHGADFLQGTDSALLHRLDDVLAQPNQRSGLPD